MRNQKVFRFLLLIVLLLAVSLSCKTITKPFESIKDIINLATDIDVEGIVTQVEGFATEIDIEGMQTEIAPMITEVQEMITEMPDLSGEKPVDIPIIEGSDEMISSKGLITYSTDKELQEVVDFYNQQMPPNGWNKTEEKVEEDSAELKFEKGGRKAKINVIAFPFIGTNVTITIEGE